MTNLMFVSTAFAVTWIALIGYAVHVQRAMRRSRELLERVHGGRKP